MRAVRRTVQGRDGCAAAGSQAAECLRPTRDVGRRRWSLLQVAERAPRHICIAHNSPSCHSLELIIRRTTARRFFHVPRNDGEIDMKFPGPGVWTNLGTGPGFALFNPIKPYKPPSAGNPERLHRAFHRFRQRHGNSVRTIIDCIRSLDRGGASTTMREAASATPPILAVPHRRAVEIGLAPRQRRPGATAAQSPRGNARTPSHQAAA